MFFIDCCSRSVRRVLTFHPCATGPMLPQKSLRSGKILMRKMRNRSETHNLLEIPCRSGSSVTLYTRYGRPGQSWSIQTLRTSLLRLKTTGSIFYSFLSQKIFALDALAFLFSLSYFRYFFDGFRKELSLCFIRLIPISISGTIMKT